MQETIRNQLEELRQQLRDTDWIVVEVLEHQLVGDTCSHNFDEVYVKRKQWREEISKLETQLKTD